MPIKTLRTEPGFPRLGRVRKGAPHSREDVLAHKRMVELAYFRLDTDREDVRQAWARLGAEPKRLHIIFPYPEMDRCWSYWQVEHDGRGLVHQCDGETMVRWRKPDGTYSTEPRPCPYAGHPELRTEDHPGCKPNGQLRFMVKEVLQQGFVGYLELVTGSWADIRNITNCLEQIITIHHVTDLTGLECDLYRQEEEISYMRGGVRKRSRHHVVYLEPSAEWVLRQMARERARHFALPEPVVDSGEEPEEIVSEEPDEPYEPEVLMPEEDIKRIEALMQRFAFAYHEEKANILGLMQDITNREGGWEGVTAGWTYEELSAEVSKWWDARLLRRWAMERGISLTEERIEELREQAKALKPKTLTERHDAYLKVFTAEEPV